MATVQNTVLLPTLAALVGLLLRRHRPLSGLTAVASSALVVVLGVFQLAETAGRSDVVPTFGPLPVGELQIPLSMLADRTSAVIAVVVGVVGFAVQVFSVWYLRDDHRYAVFASTTSLFLAAMLLLVQSGDLVLTLVGWEVMGWCSYLLIGHVSARESARRAAHKAFLVTRVADIGFVLGLVILAVGAGSTELATVVAHWTGGSGQATAALTTSSAPLTAALVLVLVGVAGKSGLVPFHDWLPDAMEGPTPASALIHAATMVAAGTYVVARLHSLYALSDPARITLGILAAVTMVWAALLAFAQSDVKRMLAYSTLSQIAIMLSAMAFVLAPNEAPGAALGHLFSHALFKALLFLALGWVSVLAGGTAFVALRGAARGRGALQWSIGIGLAALAGVPPLVGFFSKESVLSAAEESLSGHDAGLAWFVLLALLLTIALTAAYATRAWLLLATERAGGLAQAEAEEGQAESTQEAAPAGDEHATAAHRSRPVTVAAAVTVCVLAVLTVVGGLLLVPIGRGIHIGFGLAVVSVVLVVAVFFGVRALAAGGRDPAARLGPAIGDLSDRGFRVDAAYVGLGRVVTAVARLVVRLDRHVVDAYPRGAASVTSLAGRAGERAHRGTPSAGLLAVVVGVVLVAVAGVTVWH
ncbi:MAG: NADH-quinone oxidoreductase subunit L [Actinomycetota bacterium]|nr:NADH-quinone oxidoreductase subunit L [Actinomycetota bacterium]